MVAERGTPPGDPAYTPAVTESELEQFKAAQRRTWELGDYRQVAPRIEPAARVLVDAAGVAAGQRVLDVATGSGSVAIAAAETGADVVGVDLTDAWFPDARRRARAADVDVALQVGDAEALPASDASFDVVLSSFGAIFAPRHDVVAGELVRVCRPGGTVAVTAWVPGGASDSMFSALDEYLPDAPAFVLPFMRWGEPDHVSALFAPHDVAVRFDHRTLRWEFPTPEAAEAFLFESSGPFIAARTALEELSLWDQAGVAMHTAVREVNEADDGTWALTLDYLVAVGTRTA